MEKSTPQIPELKYTPVDDITGIASQIRISFLSGKTRPVEYRLKQLRKLYWGLKDNVDLITAACQSDLGKPAFETYISEVGWCMNDCIFMCNNLEKWVKDEPAPDIPLMNKFFAPRIRKDPMGAVMIIGAYNFPIQLSIGPLIGAIAAGCTAVLKPSESSPASAAAMELIINKYLDNTSYKVVQGAVPETTRLLDNRWDQIFYTGSSNVAKIIAKKAAETLTPLTLELGGLNPAIITKNADPRLAARRLLWAKVHNAGQVCVSQNTIYVDKEILPALISELKKATKEFYPDGMKDSADFARIVNHRQWQRLKTMLDASKGKILMGGTMDEKTKYFEVTVVQVDDPQDSLLVEESFGPLIPILPVSNLDEAIRIANEIHDTPLGLYAFGNKKETEKILNEIRSGGASINDGFFHAAMPTLQFGGVGTSGQGAYRGKASFDCFTHLRSVTTTPAWIESMLAIRYPPYRGKLRQFQTMNDLKPNFDRDGNVTQGLLSWLLFLGGRSAGAGVRRWLVLLLVALGARQYAARQAKS